ncbi:hypothetical protein [Neobacillus sp. 114]|uniref:hypothetical protein n=1 Tax=Neobacillus sp. 114 TaxID=3048535 RepID=UPI0024C2E7FD|nr:hypothetical protein [Neobacillus sp. 114]
MSLGKVTVWYMTEEERLAYIKKHPIVPTEKPSGATFENTSQAQYEKAKENGRKNRKYKKIMDSVDVKLLHELFIQGNPLNYIAKALQITEATLSNYIKEQREIDPEKWPYRHPWRR